MFSCKQACLCAIVILSGVCVDAAKAENLYPPNGSVAGNHGCVSGACLPARLTFGYYPTTWRRWPMDKIPKPTKPEPETIETPPVKEEPKTDEETKEPSDEESLDATPTTPPIEKPPADKPSPEFSPDTPFDDNPPKPPQDLTPKSDLPSDAPAPDGFPDVEAMPSAEPAPTDSSTEPKPPVDSLFQDDQDAAPKGKATPKTGPAPGGARGRREGGSGPQLSSVQWRTPPKLAAASNDTGDADVEEVPRRLQALDADTDDAVTVTGSTWNKSNPLRSTAPKRAKRVWCRPPVGRRQLPRPRVPAAACGAIRCGQTSLSER